MSIGMKQIFGVPSGSCGVFRLYVGSTDGGTRAPQRVGGTEPRAECL